MPDFLLAGLRVLDLAGEPAAMTGRILADLGAEVVTVGQTIGDPLRDVAWNAGKSVASPDRLDALLGDADVVLATPGWPGTPDVTVPDAPHNVWVCVTPFGLSGPRAGWRATDLGVMASSGNMYVTGDPDRAPVRCTEPSGYAHAGPEAAMGALTALASGRPQVVDVSMQETVSIANMGAAGRYFRAKFAGRRLGESIGRTREIWPCADGFVSFGLRAGRARIPNLQLITKLVHEAGLGTPALDDRDWETYDPNALSDDELRAIETPIASYFEKRTMQELYETACETNLMLAPANSPRELYASAQLAAREFFAEDGLPARCALVRSADGSVAQVGVRPAGPVPSWPPRGRWVDGAGGPGAWAGVRILEFGSGAAGPIATRFFVEHGATVLRVESKGRPDFLRVYALGPKNPHGLEGSDMYDSLNVGKRNVTLNLKHPSAVAIAKQLVQWSDAVLENFAPKAMRGLGLDYDALAADKPDLVMISACLQGQTGPHRNYPGFGSQGSALAGFNILTGWPDRGPVGPSGTITDSLAPRFVAALLAAGLLRRRRTGQGVYIDVSQVEAAIFTLSPWLLDYQRNDHVSIRDGNRSARAIPHGAFPCQGDDRWVAIAAWSDEEWAKLSAVIDASGFTTPAERRQRIDEVEALVAAWTTARTREEVVGALQPLGIEAVPVADFADVFNDPQLAHRGHFVALTHPFLGEGRYERNGFRLSDAPSGYERAGPTLGQDNDEMLRGVLGLTADEVAALTADGALA